MVPEKKQPACKKKEPNEAKADPKFESAKKSHIMVMAAMQVVLLGCLVFSGYKLYDMERNRIPPAVFNFLVQERFSAIPIEFGEQTVRLTTTRGIGSGVAIRGEKSDLVATNAHVLDGCSEGDTVWIEGRTPEGFSKFTGKVISIDRARDLGIVEVSSGVRFKTVAKFADKDPQWGQPVIMVGCPNSHLPIPTRGYYGYRYGGTILIACNAFWGNSGGPVINSAGQVIGLAHRIDKPHRMGGGISPQQIYPTYLFFCIPYDWIQDHLKENGIKLAK